MSILMISVLVNVFITSIIVFIGLKINSYFMAKFLENTENRIDEKLNLYDKVIKYTTDK